MEYLFIYSYDKTLFSNIFDEKSNKIHSKISNLKKNELLCTEIIFIPQ